MSRQATSGAGQTGELALQHGWSLQVHSSHLSVPVSGADGGAAAGKTKRGLQALGGQGDAAVQHMVKAEPIATSGGEPR